MLHTFLLFILHSSEAALHHLIIQESFMGLQKTAYLALLLTASHKKHFSFLLQLMLCCTFHVLWKGTKAK